ncbi:hypothetical protein KQH56_01190 [bacterium]|nr:hypothetical protein [bacterium]
MDSTSIFEFIGYAASLLIAISLMMKSLIRLRILNAIGAVVFIAYGLIIKAYPVSFLNGLIVIIDLYYLITMLKRSDYFTLMEVTPDSTYLNFFLNFHQEDIRTFFPSFSYEPKPEDMIFFVLRNTIPAGLVILRPEGKEAQILLDYALQDYRDLKIGAFIFDDNADILMDRGLTCLVTEGKVPIHAKYLRQMHFSQGDDGAFRRKLNPHFIRDRKL